MFDFKNYYEARTIDEAINLLDSKEKILPICGGTDVLIKLREGKLKGFELVGISNIPELHGIFMDESGTIHIGAATSFKKINRDPIIQKHINVLAQAADTVGGPQIRNMGTIGGNICNGATSADGAPTLLALNAKIKILSKTGQRTCNIVDFYMGPGKTVLQKGELVTEILIEKEDYENHYGHYFKYSMRNAMDITTLSCATVIALTNNREALADVRIALGVAAPTPIRLKKTEELLEGQKLTSQLIARMQEIVLTEVSPRTSWRASKRFRYQLIKELTKRGLVETYKKARGEA